MKLSKSEAGKLGAQASIAGTKKRKDERIEKYYLNPNHCTECDCALVYEKRHKKFCTSSCSASFNNKKRKRPQGIKPCLGCGNEIIAYKSYCSIKCQQAHRVNKAILLWKQTGVLKGFSIKNYIEEKYGYKCVSCGISEWNNKPITLELEHKDGNSENNNEDNLCLICPNCHSQTSTYKGKNKGNGRHKRMVRYYEGKSF